MFHFELAMPIFVWLLKLAFVMAVFYAVGVSLDGYFKEKRFFAKNPWKPWWKRGKK